MQVAVMLTLSTAAAENIGNVIAAIADLLRIAVPPSYEISRSPSPQFGATAGGGVDNRLLGYPPGIKRN